jgi:hypothetical protein
VNQIEVTNNIGAVVSGVLDLDPPVNNFRPNPLKLKLVAMILK